MQVRDSDGNVVDPSPTAETLITGEESQNLHLNTVEDVSCVHCYDDVFFGQPVDQVSKGGPPETFILGLQEIFVT